MSRFLTDEYEAVATKYVVIFNIIKPGGSLCSDIFENFEAREIPLPQLASLINNKEIKHASACYVEI